MDHLRVLPIIVAAFGLWLALHAGGLLLGWLRLMRLRHLHGVAEAAGRAAMAPEVAAILDPVAPRLAALGFAHEESLRVAPQVRGADEPHWVDVYVHAATGARALVDINAAPEPGFAAGVAFVSVCAGSGAARATLETLNRRRHTRLPTPAGHELADAGASTLAQHWAFHLQRLGSQVDHVVLDGDVVRTRIRAVLDPPLDFWVASGVMRRRADGWYLTPRGGWHYLHQLQAGARRTAALPPGAEIEDLGVRVQADVGAWHMREAMLAANSMTRRSRIVWFGISLLAGAAALSTLASWDMVAAFLAVILLHEGGHMVAMRAFGYRMVGVLVLPFLGAVTVGRKDDAGPWQKLAVYLAGPVPGLLLAVAAIRLSLVLPEQRNGLIELATIALAINYLNLLPLSPLDGGQVLNTFVFMRRPRLRLAFFGASALALVGAGVAMHTPVLSGMGCLLALGLPRSWRNARIGAGLATAPAQVADAPETIILRRIHDAPGPRRPVFAQRIAILQSMLPQLRGRAPSLAETAGGLLIYAAA